MEEIEKGNAFIRTLDLEAMVTPGALEEKVRMEISNIETKLDGLKTLLTNNYETQCKEIMASCTQMVSERVSKREFIDNKSFMLGLIREAKSFAAQARHQSESLQTKYEHLDEFYVSKSKFDELAEK